MTKKKPFALLCRSLQKLWIHTASYSEIKSMQSKQQRTATASSGVRVVTLMPKQQRGKADKKTVDKRRASGKRAD